MKTRWIGWSLCGLACVSGAFIHLRSHQEPRRPAAAEPKKQVFLPSNSRPSELRKPADPAVPQHLLKEFRTLLAEVEPARRAEAVQQWLKEREIAELRELLSSLNHEELVSDVAHMLIEHWAAQEPAAAAAWAASMHRNGPQRLPLLEAAAGVWWEQDRGAATSWLMNLPNPDDQLRLLEILDYPRETSEPPAPAESSGVLHEVSTRAASDARAAADWVAALPEGPERQAAIEQFVGLWAAQDSRAVMAWVHALPHESERRVAFRAAMVRLPVRCPALGE